MVDPARRDHRCGHCLRYLRGGRVSDFPCPRCPESSEQRAYGDKRDARSCKRGACSDDRRAQGYPRVKLTGEAKPRLRKRAKRLSFPPGFAAFVQRCFPGWPQALHSQLCCARERALRARRSGADRRPAGRCRSISRWPNWSPLPDWWDGTANRKQYEIALSQVFFPGTLQYGFPLFVAGPKDESSISWRLLYDDGVTPDAGNYTPH